MNKLAAIFLFAVLALPLSAATVYRVSLDTTALIPLNGYFLDFQLVGNAENILLLDNFHYPGGFGDAGPFTLSTVNQFFNEVEVLFAAGTSLRFDMTVSSVPPPTGDFPDEFSFYLLYFDEAPIPTTDGASAFLVGDIGVEGTVVRTFPAIGLGIEAQVTVVPEPGTWALLVAGLLAALRIRAPKSVEGMSRK